jgi:hypothetical protein
MENEDLLAAVEAPPAAEDDNHGFLNLADDQLARLAALIATGEEPLPLHLSFAQLSSLLARVCRLRRKRLIDLFAQAIAQDIYDERKVDEMGQ